VLGQKVNHRIDLRGMVYPLSKLETRLTLKKMAAGDVLEVLTDFLPIRHASTDMLMSLLKPIGRIFGFSSKRPSFMKRKKIR
jgi:hypothetical protein